MKLVLCKPNGTGRWKPLSAAPNEAAATIHQSAWMVISRSSHSSWATEGYDMSPDTLTEIMNALRKRQAIIDTPSILDRCERDGICLWAEDEDTLRASGPVPLADDVREAIKRCKYEIIAELGKAEPWSDAESNAIVKDISHRWDSLAAVIGDGADRWTVAARSVAAEELTAIGRCIAVRRLDRLKSNAEHARRLFAEMPERLIRRRGW